jgi:dual specificity protein kinase YAK1
MEPPPSRASPRRVLTDPPTPKRAGSAVNRDDDLIVFQDDLLTSSSGVQYRVTGSLGSGTFGQVFECAVLEDLGDEYSETGGKAAVKIIKNQAAYYHQARVEIGILQLLNTKVDPHDRHHIVRLKDFFMHKGHLCLVFELLGLNLYDLIRRNKFRGLSLSLVRVFVTHILKSLAVLRESSIIHCDIKPVGVVPTALSSLPVQMPLGAHLAHPRVPCSLRRKTYFCRTLRQEE